MVECEDAEALVRELEWLERSKAKYTQLLEDPKPTVCPNRKVGGLLQASVIRRKSFNNTNRCRGSVGEAMKSNCS